MRLLLGSGQERASEMAWKTANGDEKLTLVRGINRAEPLYRHATDSSIVETLPLPFYGDARLVKITKARPGEASLWYAALQGELVPLDGSVANIHHCNAVAPVALHAQNIGSYLKFRLFFAKEGWLEGLVATEQTDGFHATARVLTEDGVYETLYAISKRGETTVLNREKTGIAKAAPKDFVF